MYGNLEVNQRNLHDCAEIDFQAIDNFYFCDFTRIIYIVELAWSYVVQVKLLKTLVNNLVHC